MDRFKKILRKLGNAQTNKHDKSEGYKTQLDTFFF